MVDLDHIKRIGANSEAESARLIDAHRRAECADFDAACCASANDATVVEDQQTAEVQQCRLA